jgi:undecaprenyl diphosphate synthase
VNKQINIEHIAVIMDGNRRWAEKNGLPRAEGHAAGVRTAGKVAQAVRELKVPYLTLYALSTENLDRSEEELAALSGLVHQYLDREVPTLVTNRTRLKIIGDRRLLAKDLSAKIARAEDLTRDGKSLTLTLALCYGGRDDIVRAVRAIPAAAAPGRITEKTISDRLDTAGTPDPDLLIRTGGDYRLSNFLLWQAAYAELYFTRVLWPDFRPRHLRAAIASYHRRERRFGRREAGPPSSPASAGKRRKFA